jgi:small neutral amino acid transporter SnatA (MarC family)
MSSGSVLVAAVAVIAAVNAPRRHRALSIDDRPPSAQRAVAALGAALLAVSIVFLAGVADALLDALDISAPNARIAAGLVVGVGGLAELVWRRPPAGPAPIGWRAAVVPVWFPILLRPEVGIAALTLGEDHGMAPSLITAGLAAGSVLAAVTLAPGPRSSGAEQREDALGRLCSAVQVTAAIALLLGGVFAV